MNHAVAHWIEQLKVARKRQGLSQAELGRKVGLPQSYISKIESGSIDIRLSSLLEAARALELEPMLVPRKLVPAVKSLTRSHAPTVSVKPAYALNEGDTDG